MSTCIHQKQNKMRKLFCNFASAFLISLNKQEISRAISKFCLMMLLFGIGTHDSFGQTDTFKQKGVLYFKLKDTTTFTLPKYSIDYIGKYPKFQGIIDRFEVTSIEASFQFVHNSVFDRIYRMDFKNDHSQNTILDSLTNKDFVEFAEFKTKNKVISIPTDTVGEMIWYVKDLGLDKAFDVTQGDTNILIAVVDGPINTKLTDLSGKFWQNTEEIPNDNLDNDTNGKIDDFNGWDFANGDNNPSWHFTNASKKAHDKFDHGTVVSTLAVGKINNPNSTVGACPKCKLVPLNIMPMKSTDTIATWETHLENEYEAILYAVKKGAKIINLSWGGWADSLDNVAKIALDYANSQGVIIVAGAGNDNNSKLSFFPNKRFFPANYSSVVSVGALSKDRRKSSFSNYSPATKVDVMAPGDNILSGKLWGTNNYSLSSGTSLSAPLVSGIIGLIWSKNPSYSKSDVLNCLFNTCDSINQKNFEYRGKIGRGAVNAKNAINCSYSYKADFYTNKLEQKTCTDSGMLFFATKISNGKYFWTWGDGTTSIVNNQTITKHYDSPGVYSISLIGQDTITGMADTITKDNWFLVTSCKISQNSYDREWYFGVRNRISFKHGFSRVSTQTPITSYAQTAIFSPLEDDSNYVFLIKDSNSTSKSYLFKNKPRYLNSNNHFDYINASYKQQLGHSLPGLIIPDFNSDSLMILTFPPNSLLDTLHSTNILYIVDRMGRKGDKIIAPPSTGSGDSTIFGGFVKSSPYGCLIPNYNAKEYWLIMHPMGTWKNKICIYSLHCENNNRAFQKMKDIVIPSGYIQGITASPSGNLFAIQNDTMLYLYRFNPNNANTEFVQKIPGNFKSGTCFSFHDKTLYTTEQMDNVLAIVQYNLNAINIPNSKKVVASGLSEYYQGLQLGPDSIIYVNGHYKGHLGAIGFPERINSKSYSNQCGYVRCAIDLNTIIPFLSKDTTITSAQKLPGVVYQNLPDSVGVVINSYNCDSAVLTTNFPSRIFKKWIVNGIAYAGDKPRVKVNWSSINTIQLLVDSMKWNYSVNLADSVKIPLPEINFGVKQIYSSLNSVPTKLFISNTYFRGFYNVQWYRNGEFFDSTSSNDTILAVASGVYHAAGVTQCGMKVGHRVEVLRNCSDSFISKRFFKDTGIVFTAGITNITDSLYLLSGDIRIFAGALLNINKSTLVMTQGSSISVLPGGRLIIDSSSLVGCGRWKGIKIYGNGSDSSWRILNSTIHGNALITNSAISDAIEGVKTLNGGFIAAVGNDFTNNGIHIIHKQYRYPDHSIITQNTFKMLSAFSYNNLGNPCSNDSVFLNELAGTARSQCVIDSVTTLTYSDNIFLNTRLPSENSNGLNFHSIFTLQSKNLNITGNTFKEFSNTAAIVAKNSTKLNIQNNTINRQSTYGLQLRLDTFNVNGIWLKAVTNSLIESNTIQHVNIGISYYMSTTVPQLPTLVKYNLLDNNYCGLAVATDTFPLNLAYPLNNYLDTIYLQTECNVFSDDATAFVACGKIIPQGNMNIASGNKFYSCGDTAICFNQRNKIKYYYYSGSTTCCQEPYYPLTGQINPPVLLNGTLVSENDFNKINAANKNSNCLPEPPELDSLKANPVIDLKVRPNPSSESFEINFENKSHLEYSIYTIQGLKVENGTVSNGQTIGVELKHGLYLLVVKNTEGTFSQTIKIIKL